MQHHEHAARRHTANASDLHELADESFDLAISFFGAMFAPRPFDVAKEMVRVTKPGGRIVMGNWILNDPTLAELEALFNEQNTSDDATSLPATYLRVRVTR